MNIIIYTNSEKSQNFSFEFEKRIKKFKVKMKYNFIFLILIVFNSMLYSQSNIFSYEDLISLSKKDDLPNDVLDQFVRKDFKFADKRLYALIDLHNGGGKKFIENCNQYSYVKNGITAQLRHCTDKLEYYSEAKFNIGFNSNSPKYYDYLLNIVKSKGKLIKKTDASFIKTPTNIYLYQLNNNINVEAYKYLKDGKFLYVIRFLYY